MPSSSFRVQGLLLVHLGEREPDVDQDPIAGLGADSVVIEQPDVHGSLYAGDIDLGQSIGAVDDLDDLTWNGQAHGRRPLLVVLACLPAWRWRCNLRSC